jgi:hypothetical protein
MKKTFTIIASLLFAVLYAQAPPGFNYQATVKNAAGQLILNQNVNFRFSIRQGTTTSTPLYVETHQVPTDNKSQVNLIIGQGTASTGSFAQIDWSLTPLYLGVELNTGSGYVTVASNDLISVPYALYANKAGSTVIPSLGEVLQNGNDASTKKITNLANPVEPKDGVTIDYLATLKTKLDNQALKIKATSDTLIKKGLLEPKIEWEKEIVSDYLFNQAIDIKSTKDGGVVIIRYGGNNYQIQNTNIVITKLDSSGNVIWENRSINILSNDSPCRIIQTSDSGYLVRDPRNFYKLDELGNVVWTKTDLNYPYDLCFDIFENNDNKFAYNGTYAIFKRDSNGELINQSGSGYNNLTSNGGISRVYNVIPTNDGGVLIVGDTDSNTEKDFDAFVIKQDAQGNIVWKKTYGGFGRDDAKKIIQTPDGGYLFVGNSSSTDLNPEGGLWIVKLDKLGEIQWKKFDTDFTNNGLYYNIKQLIPSPNDSGFFIEELTGKLTLRKYDNNGNVQWRKDLADFSKIYFISDYYVNCNITKSIDNGYFFVYRKATTESMDSPTKLKIVKLSYKQ